MLPYISITATGSARRDQRGLSPYSVVQYEMLEEAGSEIHLRAVSTRRLRISLLFTAALVGTKVLIIHLVSLCMYSIPPLRNIGIVLGHQG